MRFRLLPPFVLIPIIIGLMGLVACRLPDQTEPDRIAVGSTTAPASSTVIVSATLAATQSAPKQPSSSPTIVPPATATTIPTSTPAATSTTTPTKTPLPSPSPSPAVDLTATVLSLEVADPIDRSCPDPPPAKPDYRRFYLSSEPWPAPESEQEEHLWLAKPLPGGGRLLYTDWLPYGYDAGGRYLLHNGIDAAEPLGTPVLAAADGTVVVAGDDYSSLYGWRCDWYGHLVVIELDRTWRDQPVYIVYGHVLNLTVRPGESVSRGQQVAEIGFGGAARTPHLHFEVRIGSNEFGATRNPFLWLDPPATRGLIVGRLVDPEGRPWQGVTVAAVGRSEGTETYRTWTYLGDPQNLINPDESFAENFVLADLRPGEYELYVELQGEVYTQPVQVVAGEIISVELVTVPLKATTPSPSPSAEPSPESA